MKTTTYTVDGHAFGRELCFALVSDLHGQDPTAAIEALKRTQPSYILMPGDIFELLDGSMQQEAENGFRLLEAAADIAPSFLSLGNHENGGTGSWRPDWKKHIKGEKPISEENEARLLASGVRLLKDEWTVLDGIAFGGLTSGLARASHTPSVSWLGDFCALPMPHVLLCHHPEYYPVYLKNLPLELIVSGHAHGGQWRILGRGVFAPGQGLFPRYTSGVHDGRFVIGRGLRKSGRVPRIFNEPEIVFIQMK